MPLTPFTGNISSSANFQIIEDLDITGHVTITHDDVIFRNCILRHAWFSGRYSGFLASGAARVALLNIDIIRTDTDYTQEYNNIAIEFSDGATLTNIRATSGSSNIYITSSANIVLDNLELYDAKGPFTPGGRGQNIQLGDCSGALIQNFSCENIPGSIPTGSYTEDNFSIYGSPNATIRFGLIDYNNGPTGVGLLCEPGGSNSDNAVIEDVDIIRQGNGVLSFYATNCRATRVRTRDGHLSTPERGTTASGGLSFYSPAGTNTFEDIEYWLPASEGNFAYTPGSSFSAAEVNFVARSPIRIVFAWEDEGGDVGLAAGAGSASAVMSIGVASVGNAFGVGDAVGVSSVGVITPPLASRSAQPFILDQSPMDSPFFVLDGDGSMAIPGRDILVEIEAYDIAGATLTTFYFGSKGYNHPTAPDYYAPRLSQPLNFRRDIYSAATTGGASRVSYGELRLINNDGALDFLKSYGLGGRRVRMLIGDVREAYDTFEPLIVGKIQQAFFNTADLAIQLRDRLQDLAKPVQVNKFVGDNVLPDGLEGVESEDIKDNPKPLLFGQAFNFTPLCVNTARLIYQVNDGPALSMLVYDNGALLTIEADYVDRADMEANAPTAGCFRRWGAGGYFRLGAGPAGTITCNASDMLAAADLTAAQVAVRIVTRAPPTGEGGVASADIDFDDVDVLDIANSASVGVWLSGGETYAQALDTILTSIGAWYGFDRLGVFRMQRLELPAPPYVVTCSLAGPMPIGEYRVVDYRFMPSRDPENGMPAWRVSLEYGRNYTVQPPSVLAGVVVEERKNFVGMATRTEVSESEAVQDYYPLAVEKTVSTVLSGPSLVGKDEAAAEADRLLTIFGSPHDFLEIDLIMTSDLIAVVDIGAVVNVVLPRTTYTTGQIMRVIGMQYNAAAGIVTLALWG